MPKYNRPQAVTRRRVPAGRTHEGAPGYEADAKGELYLLAVSAMGFMDSFYEAGAQREDRFVRLARRVALEDPEWMAEFLPWLRAEGKMRTAAVAGAAEFAYARQSLQREAQKAVYTAARPRRPQITHVRQPGPTTRSVVASVLQRPDEPAELLAYWLAKYGKPVPVAVKRGVGDAMIRLANEYGLMKYDTGSHPLRFADVLALCHPGDRKGACQHFRGGWQRDLFAYAIDRRYGRDVPAETLTMVHAQQHLREHVAGGDLLGLYDTEALGRAGMTWEDALSLAGPEASKAGLWQALIPVMNYMALLRNLRNFDKAGIAQPWREYVRDRLTDREQVARSKQLPLRFVAAWLYAGEYWKPVVSQALDLCLENVPSLSGRNLVLVDCSGSMEGTAVARPGRHVDMFEPVRSSPDRPALDRMQTAAVFGTALARRAQSADLVVFGETSRHVMSQFIGSTLEAAMSLCQNMGGTYTVAAVRRHFAGHDRVIIVTDEQSHDGSPGDAVPAHVPVYTWNLCGYRYGHAPTGRNRYALGGLADAAFSLIGKLEDGPDAVLAPWRDSAVS